MDRLVEFDEVRIVTLHGPPQAHLLTNDPSRAVAALPRVGEVGTIVHLLAVDGTGRGDPDQVGTRYIVERVTPDGHTSWLAEFSRGELELLHRPK